MINRLVHAILLCMAVIFPAYGQRDRNYIYVLDCTKSMAGYNGAPDIWADTKGFLRKEIEKLPAGTHVTVVPFQTAVHQALSETREDVTTDVWQKFAKQIDGYVENVTNTNICDAWAQGEKYISEDADNYMILLTDGLDNVRGIPEVAKRLRGWCGKYKNTYGIYVALTKNAFNSDDPQKKKQLEELRRVIEDCENLWVAELAGGIVPVGNFTDRSLRVNTLELPVKLRVPFSTMGHFPLAVRCASPDFKVEVEGNAIDNGYATFVISSLHTSTASLHEALGSDTASMTFTVESDPAQLHLLDNLFDVEISNQEERLLSLSEESMGQINLPTSHYHPAFLFCGESEPDTLTVDLNAVFNNASARDNAYMQLKVADSEGRRDFTMLFNGTPVAPGEMVTLRPGEPAVAGFVFDRNAADGKRRINLTYAGSGNLDRVNAGDPDDFELTVAGRRSVEWNPLAVVLAWTGVAIVGALLLWFLWLQRMFFPRFKAITLTFSGPGEYYATKKLKGAYKLILSSNPGKQGILSRIFKGREIRMRADHWNPQVVVVPGSKKSVRICLSRGWLTSMALLRPGEKCTMQNETTRQKTEITA